MQNSFKKILITLIIGPYLFTSFLLQSGLFTDRSRELREKMEYVSSLDIVKNQPIKVDKSGMNSSQSNSKIIRIGLLTPQLGEVFENIDHLNKSELAWTTEFNEIKNQCLVALGMRFNKLTPSLQPAPSVSLDPQPLISLLQKYDAEKKRFLAFTEKRKTAWLPFGLPPSQYECSTP